MLIKGIRSFSPNNQGVVEFYKPLTLIVGHNGAGKTVNAMSFVPVSFATSSVPCRCQTGRQIDCIISSLLVTTIDAVRAVLSLFFFLDSID